MINTSYFYDLLESMGNRHRLSTCGFIFRAHAGVFYALQADIYGKPGNQSNHTGCRIKPGWLENYSRPSYLGKRQHCGLSGPCNGAHSTHEMSRVVGLLRFTKHIDLCWINLVTSAFTTAITYRYRDYDI